ncbi:hypothetical protein P4U44_05940 [Alkalihalobacillus alcalophilus]|uniref:hypothetical protein n=1 Tax=Alkalihalobacillus alcalophilus TaxID=1445 RepID=UPI0010A64959|nr:hypothetical protein [Alkalihalobacillus alcalophilus]MED1561453.1 hypothetical protein [Alkalihalobacillus alcalophilus]
MKDYWKNKFLLNAIEAHKKVVNGAKVKGLEKYGFESDTLIDIIREHNAFTIIKIGILKR